MEYEDNELNISSVFAVLKRRWRTFAMTSLMLFALGLAIAFLLPAVYRSQAVILIEKQEIPVDLVRSTVTSFADQRIQVISQRVMSSLNLMRIVEEFNLYEDERESEAREEILDTMRSNIALDMISADVVDPKSGRATEATIAFSLAFEDHNAQKSQRVVNELVSLFLNENIKSRTDSATEATAFLNDEAETLRERVADLEAKIAEFKDANPNNRPELENVTRDLMNRTELHLAEVERRIQETVQQKIILESNLAQQEPYLPDAGAGGQIALEQLASVEAMLASAEATYDESHPDVGRLRKQVEALRATTDPAGAKELYDQQLATARSELYELRERYDPSHPDVERATRKVENLQQRINTLPPPTVKAPDNPAYVVLAARLDAAITQLASLEVQRTRLREKADAYAESLLSIPDAEAEYRALDRDYQTAVGKYNEISAKQMEARLSQNLESERKGEKFTLIEPPVLPEQPAKPNRPVIALVFAVLSLASGLGAVGVSEAMDDRVRGREVIQDIFDAPPLAYIPVIDTEAQTATVGRYALPLGSAAFVIAIAMVAVHFMVIPLDVLWYMTLRKIGL